MNEKKSIASHGLVNWNGCCCRRSFWQQEKCDFRGADPSTLSSSSRPVDTIIPSPGLDIDVDMMKAIRDALPLVSAVS